MAKDKTVVTKGDGFTCTVTPGKKAVVEVDLTQKGKESGSGKSMVLASTRVIGGICIDAKKAKGLYLAFNVFRKKK